MNKPYVKEYSEEGVLLNPINGYYAGLNVTANRATRRIRFKSLKDNFNHLNHPRETFFINPEETTYEQHKAFIEANMPKIHKSHGLQEFDNNGHKIWALNQRNDERKFNKLNLN